MVIFGTLIGGLILFFMTLIKRYHDKNPKKKCFGGKVIIKMKDGSSISEEIKVADAHPAGKKPFTNINLVKI